MEAVPFEDDQVQSMDENSNDRQEVSSVSLWNERRPTMQEEWQWLISEWPTQELAPTAMVLELIAIYHCWENFNLKQEDFWSLELISDEFVGTNRSFRRCLSYQKNYYHGLDWLYSCALYQRISEDYGAIRYGI